MVYPVIVSLAGMSDAEAGVFIGATIHDVAQVVGAGYTISLEAGNTSAIVKLLRVSCLLPAIICIGLIFGRGAAREGDGPALIPWFLLVFVALVLINSIGGLSNQIASIISSISKTCLLDRSFGFGRADFVGGADRRRCPAFDRAYAPDNITCNIRFYLYWER